MLTVVEQTCGIRENSLSVENIQEAVSRRTLVAVPKMLHLKTTEVENICTRKPKSHNSVVVLELLLGLKSPETIPKAFTHCRGPLFAHFDSLNKGRKKIIKVKVGVCDRVHSAFVKAYGAM